MSFLLLAQVTSQYMHWQIHGVPLALLPPAHPYEWDPKSAHVGGWHHRAGNPRSTSDMGNMRRYAYSD